MATELQDNNGDNEKLSWTEYKGLADMWANELSNRTELSQGLTYTQIDEKQAYFFTLYELKQDELFQEIDLFENYEFMPDELKDLHEKWEAKIENGISYNECEKFQSECEAIGYTFDYYLDANPIYLRPINPDDQYLLRDLINSNNQNQNQNMENQKDKKEIVQELIKTLSPEEIELLILYTKSKTEEFDNFFADSSSYEKLEKYKELKSIADEDQVSLIEKIVNDNTYAQSGSDNQIQVDNFLNIVHEIYNEEKMDYYLSAIPDILDGIEISPKQKEILISEGAVSIASPKHDDELLVSFSITEYGNIRAHYPHGEEKLLRISENVNLNKSLPKLEIGKLAIVNHEADYFKGQIESINGDKVILKSLVGEIKEFHKDEIYQFFPGQKYDRSEIKFLFKVKPAGINFSDLDKGDITRLMRGELTNTVFKGVSDKEGQKTEYYFKMRPEYSSKENKLTLKPYWKNKQDIMPTMAFGTALNENQIKDAADGKAIIVDGISKEEKPFTVKVHYDKDLNTFIADKFINKNELVNKESEESNKKTYKIDGRIDFTKNDDVTQNKGPKIS